MAEFKLHIEKSVKSVVNEVDSCPFGFAQGRLFGRNDKTMESVDAIYTN